MASKPPSVVMQEVTDPQELAEAQARRSRFDRNETWLQARVAEIYRRHRGKYICIAGEELFVADAPDAAYASGNPRIQRMTGASFDTYPKRNCRACMQISGEWLLCDDDVQRPIIRGEALAGDGTWVPAEFLVDTGADRTVFSAGLLALLGGSSAVARERLSGLGGVAEFATIETQIRLINEGGTPVSFRAEYAAGYPS